MEIKTEIKTKEIESIKTESNNNLELAKKFIVKNNEDVESATIIIKDTKVKIKAIKAKLDPIVKKAHESHKEIKALQKELLHPYEVIDSNLKGKINEFKKIEYAKQMELERKAEQKRRISEQKEKERLNKLAEKQMEKGNFEKAEAILEKVEEVFIPAVAVQEVQKRTYDDSSGKVTSSSKPVYSYSIFDMDLILNAIIASTGC